MSNEANRDPIYENISVQVERGAKLLDAYFGSPHWDNLIDLDNLDLSIGSHCILGQTFIPHGEAYHIASQAIPVDVMDYVASFVQHGLTAESLPYHLEKARTARYDAGSSVLHQWGDLNPELIAKIDGKYNPESYGFFEPDCKWDEPDCVETKAGLYCVHPTFDDLDEHWTMLIERRRTQRLGEAITLSLFED